MGVKRHSGTVGYSQNEPVAEVGSKQGVQPPLHQRGVGGHHEVTLWPAGRGVHGAQGRRVNKGRLISARTRLDKEKRAQQPPPNTRTKHTTRPAPIANSPPPPPPTRSTHRPRSAKRGPEIPHTKSALRPLSPSWKHLAWKHSGPRKPRYGACILLCPWGTKMVCISKKAGVFRSNWRLRGQDRLLPSSLPGFHSRRHTASTDWQACYFYVRHPGRELTNRKGPPIPWVSWRKSATVPATFSWERTERARGGGRCGDK